MVILISILAIIVLLAFAWFSTAYIVRQESVAIIERLGKFHTIATSGFHTRTPLIDSVVARLTLKLIQSLTHGRAFQRLQGSCGQ